MKKQAAIAPSKDPGRRKARNSSTSRNMPSSEEISQLAFRLYESRGWQHGNDVEDWLRAEQELVTSYSQR